MKMTPLDIMHHEFTGAFTGYSRSEVKSFQKDLSEQFELLLRENASLRERIDTLEKEIQALKMGEEELRRVVVSAERIAQEMKQNADKEAALMVREAEAERDQMLRQAREQVQKAQTEYEQVRNEKAQFLSQYKGLLQGFMSLAERYNE
ncbi:MAG: DivIVA domain-containing protein [Deinococcaceae bacterium]